MDSLLLIVAFLLAGGTAWVLLKAQRSHAVSPYLVVALWFVFLLWYVIPTAFVAPFIESEGRWVGGLSRRYFELLLIENATLLCAVSVLLLRRPYFRRIASRERPATPTAAGGWAVLLIVGLGSVLEVVNTNIFGETYLERNAFVITQQNTTAYEAAGTFAFATALATSVSLAYLLGGPPNRTRKHTIPTFVAWAWVAYQSIAPLLLGARMGLLLPLVLVALVAIQSKWSVGRAARWVAISALTLGAGGAASIVVSGARADGELSLRSIAATTARSIGSESSGFGSALLREVTQKFNAPLAGAVLLEMEGSGKAGVQPFVGAALAFVPRFVMPDKPVPGSADGTYAGHPTRIVAVLLGYDASAGNVQVSPAAKTIWALGYLGLPLLVALNAAYLMFVNSMLLSPILHRRILGFFMLGIPAFLTLISSPDECVQNSVRIGTITLSLAAAGALARAAVQANRCHLHPSVAAGHRRLP